MGKYKKIHYLGNLWEVRIIYIYIYILYVYIYISVCVCLGWFLMPYFAACFPLKIDVETMDRAKIWEDHLLNGVFNGKIIDHSDFSGF